MRFAPLILLAAVSVSAHPSGHNHQHLHQKKEKIVVTDTMNGVVVSWTMDAPFAPASTANANAKAVVTSTSTVAQATSTTAASTSQAQTTTTKPSSSSSQATTTSSASATTTSSGSNGSGDAVFGTCAAQTGSTTISKKLRFRSSKESPVERRATVGDINSKGNTGCDGYGSNIRLVSESDAAGFTYTVKAVASSSDLSCVVWNKIGADNKLTGFFKGGESASFTIKNGESQHIAFDKNTQGGMCCSPGSMSYTTWGEFLCPWLEFDFGSAVNNKWSGFDASALVEGSAGSSYASLKACTADNSVCSTLDGNGGGSNAYLPGDEAKDGIGGNLAPGAVSLVATW